MGDIRFTIPNDTAPLAPVVFCIDASGSMSHPCQDNMSRMDLLNTMVRGCFDELLDKSESRTKVEVAFLIFTDKIVLETGFMRIDRVTREEFRNAFVDRTYYDKETGEVLYRIKKLEKSFKPEGYLYPEFSVSDEDDGTDIGGAVLHAIDKLEKQKNARAAGSGSYAGTLILVTDGYPELEAVADQPHKQELRRQHEHDAIAAVKQHCFTTSTRNNLIIPFIIGVGGKNVDASVLDDYAGDFIEKAFHVSDNRAKQCFELIGEMICKSIKQSMTVNDLRPLYEDISEAAVEANGVFEEDY